MNFLFIATLSVLFSFPQVPFAEAPVQGPIQEQVSLPPILAKIAECESVTGHYDEDGNVVTGRANKYDIGKYQINVLYWQELADELGHDVYTEEGNEAIALVLYEKYGTDPWNSSKPCWGDA